MTGIAHRLTARLPDDNIYRTPPTAPTPGPDMQLSLKPDLEEARARWRAFWQHDLIKRPCTTVTCPRDGAGPIADRIYPIRPDHDFNAILDHEEQRLDATYFGGDALPFFIPSFGPDQLAAFVGARLEYSPSSSVTSWSVPFVESWQDALPLQLGAANNTWQRMIDLVTLAAERGEGRYLVGVLDLHSNFDWLAAIRDPQEVCMDLLDCPAAVRRAMGNVRALYLDVYNTLYQVGRMKQRGTIGTLPYYCEQPYALTQCDFACLLSPPQFNKFVLPALEDEWQFLDHSIYHFDGPVALQHFDTIAAAPDLDGIQWVPGAGGKPMIAWMDLLRKIQAAGKSVYVGCTPDELKVYHRELKPNLVLYDVAAKNQQEADEVLRWLENNT